MKSDHLNSAIQAVNNIISNLLNKKIYKQQLTELQKYLDDLGWDIERHIYRSLFTTLLSTPFNDSAKLSLLQQLYLDIGPIFSRHNFHSLVQFALQFDPLSTNTRLGIRTGSVSNRSGGGTNLLDLSSGDLPSSSSESKSSDQFTSSLFDTTSSSSNSLSAAASVAGTSDRAVNPGLVAKVNDISKLLKLSETEKFALLVCLNEHNCCEREIDLEKCQFSTSSEITHFILTQLTISNSPRANNLALKIQEELSVRLPTDKKESSVAFLHTPFTETLAMSSSLPSSVSSMSEDQITDMLIRESGGQLTSDMLRQFDVTPSLCAKLLFALCETSRIDTQGSGSSAQVSNSREMKTIEDVESLANICREFIPSASPLTDIIRAIDSDSFIPLNSKLFSGKSGKVNRFWHFCYSLCNTDKQGLSLLGILFFSQLWSHNLEFQYKIIENCIKLNVVAKLLSGGHSDLGQLVPQIDSLKVQPEIEGHLLEISNWKFQKVYQILVDLSTTGPVSPINDMSIYFSNVIEALRWPLQHCPDLVALGMLGCQGSISAARQKILGLTIPPLLSNNANAAVILHLMWSLGDPSSPSTHNQWSKEVLLRSMCDYYNSSHEQNEQQQRLSRILDVAQDLKALGHLLNMNSYPFVIDLACLASRREYLKLDKWLWDKVQSVGEPFIRQTVLFTAKRCPALIQGGCAIEPGVPAIIHLPSETLATLLACLHKTLSLQSSTPLPKDLNENILKMVNNSALLLQNTSRQQQLPPSVLSSSSGPSSIPPPSVLRMNPQVSSAAQQQQPVGDLAFGMGNMNLASNPSLSQSQLAMQQRLPFLNNVMNPLNPAPNPDRLRQAFGDLASIFPDVQQNVSPEIEKEADTYFQRIYNQSAAGSMSIDDVLEMLRRFQDSSNQREKEVFTCMIRNLFKEYCYFPQYPDKELLITAQLFGGIIQMGLVKYMALVVALRYVLEALRKPFRSKMYYFGIAALDRFKTKLKDYPLYCQHLASIAHFEDFPAQLVEYVKYGAQSMEPPARVPQIADLSAPPVPVPPPVQVPQIPVAPVSAPPKVTKPGTGGVASTDPSILLDHTHETLKPPETTQDRVAFIINNLSQINLHQKTEEFREVIAKESKYHPWIAHYFVVKRASIELNFHTLYSNFIDLLKCNEITELIIRETFRNIKVLLQNDKEIDNFNDRSLLKTLGHWLGMLTLAKSRPILSLDINFKFLLIEAFHKGPHELLHVVPFTAKVLESCAKSKVFKPPNPWTMGLLRTLAELHQEPDTKLNLKFEVEVLCKALSVDLKELFGISNYFQRSDLRERVLGPDSQLGKKKLVAPNLPQIGAGSGTWVSGPSAGKQEEFPSVLPSQPEKSKAGGSSPPQPIIPSPGTHTFNYHEIPLNIAQLVSFYNVPNVPLFQHSPAAKSLIKPAIERAITEWVAPVVERSMKISIITAEQIIKKDFALESDENKMCLAAHHLIRSLTAGMGMITSKETLFLSIVNNLVNGFSRTVTNVSKETIETAAHAVASENIDLAVCFIQKTAVEKAKIELDKRLAPEYESRKRARAEGRRFCDPATLTYQAERMPEAIRLKVGSVPAHQFHVYEDIGRNIPGFISPVIDPPTGAAPVMPRQLPGFQMPPAAPTPSFPQEEQVNNHDSGLVNLYDKLVSELETLLGHFAANQQPPALIQTMHTILETVAMARSNPRDIVGALNLIQRVLDAIAELLFSIDSGIVDMALTSRGRDLYLVILKALADQRAYGHQWTTKQITRLVLERLLTNQAQSAPLPDELFDVLMRSMLINLPLLDHNLAQAIESAQSPVALAFTLQFVKIYGQQGLQEREIAGIISALVKLAKTAGGNLAMEIQQVLDVFRSSGPETMVAPRPEEPTDPPEFQDKTERLLRDWIAMYNSSADLNKVFSIYVQQMNHQGILKTDDSITRFFRLSTELCVEHCYRILTANQPQTQQTVLEARSKCFQILDAFAHLIVMLVKHSGQHPAVPAETQAKLNLLSKVLSIIAQVAIHDQEARAENFQHLPYYRIFIILFMEVTLGANYLGNSSFAMGINQAQLDPLVETIQFQVLSAFCHTLRILKPSKVPSFAYAWLDFISHRTFMDKCLNGPASAPATGSPKGWPLYAQLLIELIKFLAPFLRSVELSGPVDLLYKGTLKVLLVLLHDFPEFLCEFCNEICDSIPCNAIQMRNLVLSAFPRNMRLPDPFTPNLKIDSLPEITLTPKGTSTAVAALSTVAFKKDLDSYLRNRSPVTFLSELRGYLQQSSQVDSIRYNIPLINALVLYVGQAAIQTITPKHINMTAIAHSSHMDIFQNLAVDLDTEGRYLFLNAIANQLRYPNSYTHYFSCTLLYLFAESNTEAIQEQITRVLLERLIVNRPHPWGLLITFVELIKNPAFKFWQHEFVRCAPEIEKLFESVAKSCMQMAQSKVSQQPQSQSDGSDAGIRSVNQVLT